MSDIKVMDSEYDLMAKQMGKFGETLEEIISQYILCLSNIGTNAYPSGELHDAIVCFVAYIRPIENKVKDLGQKYKRISEEFYKEIDEDDSYLYELKGGVVRNYTDDEYKNLMRMVDRGLWGNAWHESLDYDGFKRVLWWAGNLFRGYKWNDVKNPKANIDKCHKKLLDYNDAEASTLKSIFMAVRETNIAYAKKYNKIYKSYAYIHKYITKAASIIEPSKGEFTVENIQSTLGPLLAELEEYYDEAINVYCKSDKLSIKQIRDFASQPWADTYFNGIGSVFDQFLGELSYADDILSAMYLHDEKIRELIEDPNNPQAYEEYVMKNELMDMLNIMAHNETLSGLSKSETRKNLAIVQKYMKKYGDNWLEKLKFEFNTKDAGNLDQYLVIDKVVKILGGAGKVLKYMDVALEPLVRLISDYSKNDAILQSFKANTYESVDPLMSKVAKEMMSIYESKMIAVLDSVGEKVEDIGAEKAIEWVAKEMSPDKRIAVISKSVVYAGKITGLREEYQSLEKAKSYIRIYKNSISAYQSALLYVKNADKNSSKYNTYVENLNNCFNMAKTSAAEAFKAISKFTHGSEKGYYEYCANAVQDATMHLGETRGPINIMSYEEYMAV